jgi:hypothetical protein
MADRVIIIELGPRTDRDHTEPGVRDSGGKDVWNFGGMRKTLWGNGGSEDPLGVRGIRQALWGK